MDRSSIYPGADGTRIWYGTVGSGPPLVLCDGLACDGFIWPHVVDHFCQNHMVVRWHYRGHGRSDDPDDISSMNIEQMCADLHGVLDALDIDQAVLAGHSMGVQVILQYFDLYSDRVRALVPICGSYKRPLDTLNDTDFFLKILPRLKRLVERSPAAAQAVWKALVPSKFSYFFATMTAVNSRLARGADFAPYLEHVAEMDVEIFMALLENVAEHSAEPILPHIDVPTLIIAGEKDEITPLYRSEEMHRAIEGSQMVVLPGGTHVGPIELPELVNNSLESFYDEHALGAT